MTMALLEGVIETVVAEVTDGLAVMDGAALLGTSRAPGVEQESCSKQAKRAKDRARGRIEPLVIAQPYARLSVASVLACPNTRER